jgi:flagellar hook assembly protein FlgD
MRDAACINWSLASDGPAVLDLLDPSGRRLLTLADGPQAAGAHACRWDGRDGHGRDLPSGVYFLRLTAGEVVQSRSLLVVR